MRHNPKEYKMRHNPKEYKMRHNPKEYKMQTQPTDQLTDSIIYALGVLAVLIVWLTA